MKLLLPFLLLLSAPAFTQVLQGSILNEKDKSPVAFAKIGVVSRGLGTLANEDGSFSLPVDNKFNNDTIRISCTGFQPFKIKVSDFKHASLKVILLKERPASAILNYQVNPAAATKTYGTSGKSSIIEINGGLAGSEAGVMFDFTSPSLLQKISLNVDTCTVDTIFFRVNVYKPTGENTFQNTLTKPVYFKIPGNNITNNTIDIDLSADNIWVKGHALITIEQVKTFNKGILRFTGKSGGKTYARRASQGNWRISPTTMSMLVEARAGK